MYDNIGACSHNQCCSGNATVWLFSYVTISDIEVFTLSQQCAYGKFMSWAKVQCM